MTKGTQNEFRVLVDTAGLEGPDSLPPNPEDTFQSQAGALKAVFQKEEMRFDFDKLNDEWKQRITQVNTLGQAADATADLSSGFRLTEIDLGLTITAEGHFAFVASASASATIQLKFTRSEPPRA
jgi:hypothetical protein